MLDVLWQGVGVAVFSLIGYGVWMGAFHRVTIRSVSAPVGCFVYQSVVGNDFPSLQRQGEAVEGWLESQGLRERVAMHIYRYDGAAHQVGYCLPVGTALPTLPPGFCSRELASRPALASEFLWRNAASYAVSMTRVPPALLRAYGQAPPPSAEMQVQLGGQQILFWFVLPA